MEEGYIALQVERERERETEREREEGECELELGEDKSVQKPLYHNNQTTFHDSPMLSWQVRINIGQRNVMAYPSVFNTVSIQLGR